MASLKPLVGSDPTQGVALAYSGPDRFSFLLRVRCSESAVEPSEPTLISSTDCTTITEVESVHGCPLGCARDRTGAACANRGQCVWEKAGATCRCDPGTTRAACDAALTAINAEAELRAVRDDHSETLEASKAEAEKRLADANEAHRVREESALQTHMATVASLEDERKAVEAECSTIKKERDHVASELVQAKDEISRLGDGLAKANVQNRSLEASLAALEERAMSDSQKSRKSIGEARKELHETTAKLHIEEEKTERLTEDKARLETEVQSAIEETEAARRDHITCLLYTSDAADE